MFLHIAISCSIFLLIHGCGPMRDYPRINQIQLDPDTSSHEPTFACHLYPWICGLNHSKLITQTLKNAFQNITNATHAKIFESIKQVAIIESKINATKAPQTMNTIIAPITTTTTTTTATSTTITTTDAPTTTTTTDAPTTTTTTAAPTTTTTAAPTTTTTTAAPTTTTTDAPTTTTTDAPTTTTTDAPTTTTTTAASTTTTTTDAPATTTEVILSTEEPNVPLRYPGQARTRQEALKNLHKSIHKALTQMLLNVGLNPTINYTIKGYEPDNVIVATDITPGRMWTRNTGEYIIKDNIAIAHINGSRYDKAISIELHNIEFPLSYGFWQEAGAIFVKYLKKLTKVLVYEMYVEV